MGASATYSETIGTAAPKSREITSNGCPNHYSYCTGKNGMGTCGGTGNKGSDTEAMEQTKELKLPAEPVLRASYGIGVANSDVQCALGAIGIAVNGVSIFGGAVNQACEPINVDDIASEWESFDCCSGHSERTGDYHYHFPPSCLLRQVGDLADGHSPQIGWAFDGFPIYGPKGPGGIDMKFGGSLGPCTGSHCLDECSGLEAEFAGVDKFKYRYYIVGATSDLSMLPTDPKPSAEAAAQFNNGRRAFTPTCYRGYTYSELEGGATGGSGVSAGYTATPHAGVATKYAPENLCMGGGFTTTAEATNGFCSTTTKSSCHANFAGVGAPSPPPTPPPTPPTPSPPPTPPPTPPTPSPPPTPPPTQTPTPTPTQTPTPTPTQTPTPTPTQTPTESPTQTPTPTPTPPSSPSATPTQSPTPTPQPSPSPWSRGSADAATGQGSTVGALVSVVLLWVL